ncbi:MAG: type I-MYXAN CRISPR-associated protein Cmx8 [Pyrinomonadaceae bacterium]
MIDVITLEYELAELPSSQHRAGLAGLVMMLQWLQGQPNIEGTLRLEHVGETGARISLDKDGLVSLFDFLYAASEGEVQQNTRRKDKTGQEIPPIREETVTSTDYGGATKTRTVYVYPKTIPKGAFLCDYDRSDTEIWIKLWRDMIWSILRGVPATRRPYEVRAGTKFSEDAVKVWNELLKGGDRAVELPSTYFIGAQASNAENVPFKDRARFQFLLHFWVFVAQIYLPIEWSFDRKAKKTTSKDWGYVLAVPDVAHLEIFCEEFPDVLQARGAEMMGYRPKEAVIDIASEGAFDFMMKLSHRIATKVDFQIADLLLGVDVLHVEKDGNNVRLWSNSRIDPIRETIDRYENIKKRFNDPVFRKQLLANVLEERDWFHGFGALLSKVDKEQAIGNEWFRRDVRKAFEQFGVAIKNKGEIEMDTSTEVPKSLTIEAIVYRLVGVYVSSKLRSKYQLEWAEGFKGTPKEVDYNEKKRKVAREAFLAIRSRTDADFIDYFASTLCAYPQFLNEEGYGTLSTNLYQDTDRVRTLTMLALSAKG